MANPFLDAYRNIIDRYPALWVLEPSFPQHLRDFIAALDAGSEERAIEVTRAYYRRVDQNFTKAMQGALGDRVSTADGPEPRKRKRSP